LVRLHGRPIGWLRIEKPGSNVSAAYLRRTLDAQLRAAVLRSAWRQRLDDVSPLPELEQHAVSVIVCTRDRTESLAACLDALLAVDHAPFEIIVVDNAPGTEGTAHLVQQRIAQLNAARGGGAAAVTPPVLRYVRETRAGLDWARNRGLQEARHAIVAYTDDDVRVDSAWVRNIVRAFADPEVQLVTGLVVPGELATDAQVIFEDDCGGMGKGLLPRVVGRSAIDAWQRLGAHHLGVGANMAFRREWLQRLGGFDTALDVGTASHGGGDLDIFHRSMLAGGVARYEPRAFVRHHHRREMPALRRQLRDNGRAFGVYLFSRWALHERPRTAVVRYALGTWLPWLAGRVVRRLRSRERLSIPLQFEELRGMLASPFAWRATYAADRRMRLRDVPVDQPAP
ncbi:MAG TPA: glycosyltransferase, partial [Gemmatimonadaceae bacterium]|nr:glycosyltransferase [Gemmatimonadaceae bacterium]